MAYFSILLACLLAHLFALVPLVAGLELQWPANPEANVKFSLQWSGGTAPVSALRAAIIPSMPALTIVILLVSFSTRSTSSQPMFVAHKHYRN